MTLNLKYVEEVKPFHCVGVQIAQMEAMWPHVEKYFKSFEQRSKGEVTAVGLLRQVMEGIRQCWVATDGDVVKACALTEICVGPLKTVMLNFCAGEDRDLWRDEIVRTIEEWAKSIDSKRVRIICRPGWTREIKGYRETHRVLERDLA